MTLETIRLELSDPAWSQFVRGCPRALPFHYPSWSSLFADCYGYRPLVLAVVDGRGNIVGGVPALDVRRPLGPRRCVSLPFTDYCPLLSASESQTAVAQSLIAGAAELRLGALEVRCQLPSSEHVHTSFRAVRHTMELCPDPATVALRISKHHRRYIRRAEQADLSVRFGTTIRDMDTFYRLHVLTRQRLGVPVQPWHFFESLALMFQRERLGFVAVVLHDDVPVAAAVC